MTKVSYVHFKFLPLSMRVLFTMVLLVFGIGYMMAMIQVWESHAGKDGNPMLSAKDLMISYSGNPEGTKLESALRGPMADMLDSENKQKIFNWLHNKAPQDEFDSTIGPILQEHCVACHNSVTFSKTTVTFPSGVTVTAGDDTRCMECHQGRESKVSVDQQIEKFGITDMDAIVAPIKDDQGNDVNFGFRNVHYYACWASPCFSKCSWGRRGVWGV